MFCLGSLSEGGAERVICNLSNALIESNNIKIISLTRTHVAYKLDKKIEVNFIDRKKYSRPKNKFLKMIRRLTKNLNRIVKVKNIIKSYKPDIIISFLPEPCFLILTLKKYNKIPTIISVRNDPKKEYESKLYYYLMKKLYPRADGVVFQTEEAKEYFNSILHCSMKIIPNPINPEFISKPYEGKRNKIIVNVGRLHEQKNQELLIDAFSKISKKFYDYKLIIFGEGALRDKLNKQINELNLRDRVKLAGICQNLKDKIYNASLFVLCSNYEGMPNALMEAMTMGIPVISTDCPCGGPRFLINNNENGILVEPKNMDELVQAMEKILSNEEFATKLGKNASEISKILSPEIINDEWNNYIEEIYNLSLQRRKDNGRQRCGGK